MNLDDIKSKLKLDDGGKKMVAIFMSTLLVYAVLISVISHHSTAKADAIDTKLDSALTHKRFDVFEQLIDINPLKGEATVRIEPWPLDEYYGLTFRSGWVPNKDTQFTVDAVIGNSSNRDNVYNFSKNIPVGGFDVTIDQESDKNSDISKYPFDTYRFPTPIAATYTDEKGQEQNLPILPQDYTKRIDTFDIKMNHTLWTDTTKTVSQTSDSTFNQAVSEYEGGNASSTFIAKRTNSTKLLTLIILLLMVTALSSVSLMAFLVAKGVRPPTLSALTWSAALTFSLIGLRNLFPGSPPIGVLIDRIVYFPALLLTLAASLSILVNWTKREDYVN